MRLRITFKVKGGLRLPVNNNHILQSFIYKYLEKTKNFGNWHDEAYVLGNKKYRLFTFSSLFGQFDFDKKTRTISFKDEVSLTISSPNADLLREILEVMIQENARQGLCLDDYGKQVLSEVRLVLLKDNFEKSLNRAFKGNAARATVRIRMLSPLTIHGSDKESNKTHYFAPEEDKFEVAINQNLKNKYQAYTGQTLDDNIEIKPAYDKEKKSLVRKFVTRYKNDFYITAWRGDFFLTGSREAIQFLYQAGIGDKNAQGFGMFKFVD